MDYKKTISGSIGSGMSAVFNGSKKPYYILEHRSDTPFHPFGENQTIIVDQVELGRQNSCQVRFDASCNTVSRRHAAIIRTQGQWKLISLSQTHSTYVNGIPVRECFLSNGDEIRLSSDGPVMGFIVPGESMPLNRISGTQRLALFRKQALRPYRAAIIVLFLVVLALVAALILLGTRSTRESNVKAKENQANIERIMESNKAQMENVQNNIDQKNLEIGKLEQKLRESADASDAELEAVRQKLEKSRKEQHSLERKLKDLSRQQVENAAKQNDAQTDIAGDPAVTDAVPAVSNDSLSIDQKVERIVKSMNDNNL